MAHIGEIYQSRYGMVPAEIANQSDDELQFLGFGRKARERRAERRESKEQFKLDKIRAKAEGRAQVAAAGGGMAGLGSGLGGILSTAANALGLGGGDANAAPTPGMDPVAMAPQAPPRRTGLIVGGIIAAVVVVLVIVVVMKKKSK